MKKILLATDFSEDAASAFEFAILLTQKTEGELLITHSYAVPYLDPATPISMVDTMHTEVLNSYKKRLERLVVTAQEIGVPVNSELKMSDVRSGIQETITEHGIDYLVIGKTGETGFLSKIIGSNTSDIINNVKIPTFVVPKSQEAFLDIKEIIYGTQLEFDELEQLEIALKIAKVFDAGLNLVHVKAPHEMDIINNNILMKEIKDKFVDESFKIDIINADSVDKGLRNAISLFNSDLLVVSSHSRSFLTQLVNPSKSQKLADDINVPLLVLHFQEK